MAKKLSRRRTLQWLGYTGLGLLSRPLSPLLNPAFAMLKRPIPSSGELLPAVGLGTWIQFDVGTAASERQPLRDVLTHLAQKGGRTIDSSPMYGRSEQVIGELTTDLKLADNFFYATKVWTRGRQAGIEQMEDSMRKMRRRTMDLMQVHNLVDWQTHWQTLKRWKAEGKIRYTGITHYTDAAHPQLEEIIKAEKPDFVQFNYSIRNRHAEQRLLPAAQANGTAVIINQPFESGALFNAVAGKKLPDWAREYEIQNWAQFFLKYLLAHPAVTCVIPGTSDPLHLLENVGAGYGRQPDENTRKKMAQYMDSL